MAKTLPTRKDVPVEYTWRLEDIFATDEQWEKEFEEIMSLLPKFSEYKGRLGESAQTLYEALQYRDHVFMRLGKLYAYAHMRHDEDTANSLYQGLETRAEGLYAEAGQATAFIVPEILAMDEDVLRTFLQQYEPLRLYAHELDEMNRQRPHVLSEKEEALLAQAAEVMNASSNTFGALNNADLRFPTITDENGEEVEVTHGRYIRFLESEDRRVRHDAFKAVYDTYRKYENTFASTLSGAVKRNNFFARVRNYRSAREAALSKNQIPETVYDNLIETIHRYLPLLHRYVQLRKRVLGLDELHMYDLYTPLVKQVDMKVTYEEAKDILLK